VTSLVAMKTLAKDTPFFIFDVESIGIHGESFAVAGGVYVDGREERSFFFSMDPDRLLGEETDRIWIKSNVPYVKPNCSLQFSMLNDFYFELDTCRSMYPDLVVCAECVWPVEANFLSKVIAVNPVVRKWDGPYPLIDITSIMYAAGLDPMETWEREPAELPAHNPLCDVRLSARILKECLNRLSL
jgi:hypothetical protein